MPSLKDVQEFISQHTFCYANKNGQGHARKEECACYASGEKTCEAFKEMNAFHEMYARMEQQGLSRKQILQSFEASLEVKESSWYQYNVIK